MPRQIDPAGLVGGINAVEALIRKEPRRIRGLSLQRDSGNQRLFALQRAAEEAGIHVRQIPAVQLSAWFPGPHEGAVAFCESRALEDWAGIKEKMLVTARSATPPVAVVPAALEDPRNLGACVRVCVGLGAIAMLLPGKGSTGLTPVASKAAAGTENALPICRVPDIEKELRDMAGRGFGIFGLDTHGEMGAQDADLKGPVILVVGGEDRGIPPHIARTLTRRLRLPMAENCHSYNASVALSLLLYETARQRGFSGLK